MPQFGHNGAWIEEGYNRQLWWLQPPLIFCPLPFSTFNASTTELNIDPDWFSDWYKLGNNLSSSSADMEQKQGEVSLCGNPEVRWNSIDSTYVLEKQKTFFCVSTAKYGIILTMRAWTWKIQSTKWKCKIPDCVQLWCGLCWNFWTSSGRSKWENVLYEVGLF